MVRIPLVVGLVLALAASQPARAADEASQVIVVQERVPFTFLLGTPTGEVGRTSSSEIIRIVSDLLRRHTNFDLEQLDASLMSRCRGRLSCLTLEARDDYERAELVHSDGQPIPFREHVRRLREAETPYPRYLLVVSNVTIRGQPDRLSAVLVNTDLAMTYVHEARRDAPDWEDAVEAKVNSAAVVTAPARAEAVDPRQAEDFLTRLFTEAFRPAFESTSNWEPYGSIEVSTSVAGAAVFLDDQPLGSTQSGLTRIERVMPRVRSLRIEHPDYETLSTTVRVRRGEASRVDANLRRVVRGSAGLPRQLTLWTGVAMVAAGTSIAIYGATRPQAGLRTSCFEVQGSDCSGGRSFVTFGYDPALADTDPQQINPPGVLVVPLGYSLAGAGATFGVGALLTDEGEMPWPSWIAGLAVGALAYGVSAAVGSP